MRKNVPTIYERVDGHMQLLPTLMHIGTTRHCGHCGHGGLDKQRYWIHTLTFLLLGLRSGIGGRFAKQKIHALYACCTRVLAPAESGQAGVKEEFGHVQSSRLTRQEVRSCVRCGSYSNLELGLSGRGEKESLSTD
jgi:hypothetical protein